MIDEEIYNHAFAGDGTGHLFFLVAFLCCLVAEIVSTIVSNAFSCAQTRLYATAARHWFISVVQPSIAITKQMRVAFAADSCGGMWVFAAVYWRSLR